MRFEWDESKNRRNLAKHRLSFETAQLVFEDPNVLSLLDRVVEGEERWQSIGLIDGLSVVVVAHSFRDQGDEEVIRIISARKATPLERKCYEDSCKE
jgi:uncharacterized DUF497 family protein